MDISKKGLGRGLSSLMGETSTEVVQIQNSTSEIKIPISKLKPSSIQPRRLFDKNSINELAESIKAKGLVQPILVRPSKSQNGEYEIIAGERRWRAAQIAQLHELPAVIKNLDDAEALEMAIIENVQRADLSPIEEAAGYKKLMEQYNHTQEALAPIIGKSRSHIANIIRLLNLPASIQDMISQGIISSGHARAIMNAAFPEQLAKKIVDENLSVRQAEKLAKDAKIKTAKIKPKAPDTIDLEQKISEVLGLEAVITDNGKRGGSIKIKYKTLDQLELVTSKLKK
ncbi:MAG: ParB/RepB/Spo0J family partition protein [Candidatus Pelagibacterales bacterium]|jgi:ParB family chromosome partitioning protein|tara:strand:- start:1561 stop:2415 length:855 start_codon:yes stop_codon:yes gene_type:complete